MAKGALRATMLASAQQRSGGCFRICWEDGFVLRALGVLRQKTDYRRWRETRNIYESWDSRSRRAAELIPAGSRVIEFGAGKRVLEGCLDASCDYVPSDIVDRGPGTVIIDLNQRPLPDLDGDPFDVAVFMGVLEYLTDLPEVVEWLSKRFRVCVVSYACVDNDSRSRRAGRPTVGRIFHGWLNSYSEEELTGIFGQYGYRCEHAEPWEDQRLFVFTRDAA